MMKESRIKHLETNLFLSLERVHNGMSELKIEKEKEFIREILNSNGCETQLKHVKEVFTNFIKISINDINYFNQFHQNFYK